MERSTCSHFILRRTVVWIFLVSLYALCAGCHSMVQISVQSSVNSNGGKPFYTMVRTIERRTDISEDYQAVSNRLFSHPPDESVKESQVIFPGQSVDMTVERPGDADLGVYFFFTEPGAKWKVRLEQPIPSEVNIELGTNQIKRVRVWKQ